MSDDSSAASRSDSADARTALQALHDTITSAATEVVWRQWSALGGMTSARRRARALIDPEALVLMSLTLRESEPRIVDVVADWAARNSDLLSVQRMRNLSERYPDATRVALAAVARVAFEEGKDHRWKPLLRDGASSLARRRNKVRATRAEPSEPATLLLRLRLAFGVGIKADVLTFLLGTDEEAWADVKTIATATGYTIAAVRKGINDLAEARFIEEMAGDRTAYSAPKAGWQALLGTQSFAAWRAWNERFAFVAALLDWTAAAHQRPLTAYTLASHGAKLIEAHAAAFRWHRVWSAAPAGTSATPSSIFSSAIQGLAERMVAEA